jgi:hypothetical protein
MQGLCDTLLAGGAALVGNGACCASLAWVEDIASAVTNAVDGLLFQPPATSSKLAGRALNLGNDPLHDIVR